MGALLQFKPGFSYDADPDPQPEPDIATFEFFFQTGQYCYVEVRLFPKHDAREIRTGYDLADFEMFLHDRRRLAEDRGGYRSLVPPGEAARPSDGKGVKMGRKQPDDIYESFSTPGRSSDRLESRAKPPAADLTTPACELHIVRDSEVEFAPGPLTSIELQELIDANIEQLELISQLLEQGYDITTIAFRGLIQNQLRISGIIHEQLENDRRRRQGHD